jgi:hypothetical protein
MAKSAKYWETEQPRVLSTEKNEIRFYPENGKIQVFPKVSNAPRGVGKGATIDLDSMTVDELRQLGAAVAEAIKLQLDTTPANVS